MEQGDGISIAISGEDGMVRLADDIAVILRPGDVVALSGPLGAGKSTFARALIRAVAADAELEVPSPTFTLVQAYPTRVPIAHFDLYRLSDPEELAELGLDEAVLEGAVLIEWPEKAGDALPRGALWLRIADGDAPEARRISLSGPAETMERLRRTLAVRAFLDGTAYADATRRYLLGDASSRTYETLLTADGVNPILMNAPARPSGPPIREGKPYSQIAHLAESVVPFVAIGRWLHAEGLGAPKILEQDIEQGILVVENLGTDGVLTESGEPIEARYAVAIARLAELHGRPVPRELPVDEGHTHIIPDFDLPAMLIEVEQLLDWYVDHQCGQPLIPEEREEYLAIWSRLLAHALNAEQSLLLRDYHSPNLFWLAERSGTGRIGMIDFQDAMIGPAAYDVASLVRDARVTVPEEMAERLLSVYVEARRDDPAFDEEAFRAAVALMAAQRNTKILGIFVRLLKRDGKPGYLRHLPRIRAYLRADLGHEMLQPLRSLYDRMGLLKD